MEAQTFKLQAPKVERGRAIVHLPKTKNLLCAFMVLKEGGENSLHSHPNMDGIWLVLEGRVRFYTEQDRVVAELGKNEGIMIPHDFKYWFESVGEEPLQILQVESLFTGDKIQTNRFAPQKLPPIKYYKQTSEGLVETGTPA